MNEPQGHTKHVFACDADPKDGLTVERVGACLQVQKTLKGSAYGQPVNLNREALERLARVVNRHLAEVAALKGDVPGQLVLEEVVS